MRRFVPHSVDVLEVTQEALILQRAQDCFLDRGSPLVAVIKKKVDILLRLPATTSWLESCYLGMMQPDDAIRLQFQKEWKGWTNRALHVTRAHPSGIDYGNWCYSSLWTYMYCRARSLGLNPVLAVMSQWMASFPSLKVDRADSEHAMVFKGDLIESLFAVSRCQYIIEDATRHYQFIMPWNLEWESRATLYSCIVAACQAFHELMNKLLQPVPFSLYLNMRTRDMASFIIHAGRIRPQDKEAGLLHVVRTFGKL